MPVEECPNCVSKVIFNTEGICPSCGKSKYILSGKSRELLLFERDKKELEEKTKFYKKRVPALILGGIIISLGAMVAIILMVMAKVSGGKFMVMGIMLGMAMIAKGFMYIRDRKESRIVFDKKYKNKFPYQD